MDLRDPLERLAELDPEPGPAEPPGDSLLQAVLERARDQDASRRRRRRRAGTALIAVASLSAAATAWAVAQRADDPNVAACYESVALDGARIGVTDAEGEPAEACLDAGWAPGMPFHVPGQDAPHLEACVQADGSVAVFPAASGDPCAELGLAPFESGRPPGTDAGAVGLPGRISEIVLDACLDLEEAERVIRGELDRSGLDHWAIEVARDTTTAEPCASVAVDVPEQTVHLIPIPDRPD